MNQKTKIKYSPDDDYNDNINVGPTMNADEDIIIEEMVESLLNFNDNPDGIPLFDTNEKATLFGLEPRADVDQLDNRLQFTGPNILLFSIYVILFLFFVEEASSPPDPACLRLKAVACLAHALVAARASSAPASAVPAPGGSRSAKRRLRSDVSRISSACASA